MYHIHLCRDQEHEAAGNTHWKTLIIGSILCLEVYDPGAALGYTFSTFDV
jgi:hypothetical protein